MLRGSKGLVGDRASQASLDSEEGSCSNLDIFTCSGWNYRDLLQNTACGLVKGASGALRIPLGVCLFECFTSLSYSHHYHGAQQPQKDTICCAFIPESDCSRGSRAGKGEWMGNNAWISGSKGMHSCLVKGSLLSEFAQLCEFLDEKWVCFCRPICIWVALGSNWPRF